MTVDRMSPRGGDFPDHRDDICLRCRTSPLDIRAMLLVWRGKLERVESCKDLLGRSEIVLAEILNNIAEHGHGNGQGYGSTDWIELRCRRLPDGIHMTVKDHGRALPKHLLSMNDHPATSFAGSVLDDLPEGGFGWFMIRELACDLCCDRTETGNRLSFLVPRHHVAVSRDWHASQKCPNPT